MTEYRCTRWQTSKGDQITASDLFHDGVTRYFAFEAARRIALGPFVTRAEAMFRLEALPPAIVLPHRPQERIGADARLIPLRHPAQGTSAFEAVVAAQPSRRAFERLGRVGLS